MTDKRTEMKAFVAAYRLQMAPRRTGRSMQNGNAESPGVTVQDGFVTVEGIQPSGTISAPDKGTEPTGESKIWIPEYKRARIAGK